jgi:hypothetical protein
MSTGSLPRVGDFYAVEPGQGELEYYPGSLDGLIEAMKRARQLSRSNGVQRVRKTCGRETTSIREYENGDETWRSSAAMIPAGPPVPPPSAPVTLVRRAPRPVSDINEPPCNGDSA